MFFRLELHVYYCWWLKSQTTTWDVWNPINNGINYLYTGAGFQPSTVFCLVLGVFTIQQIRVLWQFRKHSLVMSNVWSWYSEFKILIYQYYYIDTLKWQQTWIPPKRNQQIVNLKDFQMLLFQAKNQSWLGKFLFPATQKFPHSKHLCCSTPRGEQWLGTLGSWWMFRSSQ